MSPMADTLMIPTEGLASAEPEKDASANVDEYQKSFLLYRPACASVMQAVKGRVSLDQVI